MAGEAFIFLGLSTLAAFILWEGWQRRRASRTPLSRPAMERGFIPGSSSQEIALFVMGAAGLVFGFILFIDPSQPPFHGRGAVVDAVLFQLFGIWGSPVVCWVLALTAFLAALKLRRGRLRR